VFIVGLVPGQPFEAIYFWWFTDDMVTSLQKQQKRTDILPFEQSYLVTVAVLGKPFEARYLVQLGISVAWLTNMKKLHNNTGIRSCRQSFGSSFGSQIPRVLCSCSRPACILKTTKTTLVSGPRVGLTDTVGGHHPILWAVLFGHWTSPWAPF
jgi:hypothetical protein